MSNYTRPLGKSIHVCACPHLFLPTTNMNISEISPLLRSWNIENHRCLLWQDPNINISEKDKAKFLSKSHYQLWPLTNYTGKPSPMQIRKRKWTGTGHTLRKSPGRITRQSLQWKTIKRQNQKLLEIEGQQQSRWWRQAIIGMRFFVAPWTESDGFLVTYALLHSKQIYMFKSDNIKTAHDNN